MREPIKNGRGVVIGFREDQGSKVMAYDWYGHILGHYDKGANYTFTFTLQRVGPSDLTIGLIYSWAEQANFGK